MPRFNNSRRKGPIIKGCYPEIHRVIHHHFIPHSSTRAVGVTTRVWTRWSTLLPMEIKFINLSILKVDYPSPTSELCSAFESGGPGSQQNMWHPWWLAPTAVYEQVDASTRGIWRCFPSHKQAKLHLLRREQKSLQNDIEHSLQGSRRNSRHHSL